MYAFKTYDIMHTSGKRINLKEKLCGQRISAKA